MHIANTITEEKIMPLKDAENFIKEIAKNNEFRKSFYKFKSSMEVQNQIRILGFSFKLFEFEESINHLKSDSPTEEQAIMLNELLIWWQMLMYDGTVMENDSVSCSPDQCSACSSCR